MQQVQRQCHPAESQLQQMMCSSAQRAILAPRDCLQAYLFAPEGLDGQVFVECLHSRRDSVLLRNAPHIRGSDVSLTWSRVWKQMEESISWGCIEAPWDGADAALLQVAAHVQSTVRSDAT